MIKPTVGRVVLFTPAVSDLPADKLCQNGIQPLAAIIVYVWSDTCVNLAVFDANGQSHSRTSVPLLDLNDETRQGMSYFCEWMPYQVGQAAKTETAENALQASFNSVMGGLVELRQVVENMERKFETCEAGHSSQSAAIPGDRTSTTIIVKDGLRGSVEAASGGKQTILRTAKGQASYFNIISRSDLEALHPAFVVVGTEKSELFIGTYQAVVRDGEAISLPDQDPATNINYDAAGAACAAAGPGFHMLTNWEWAAVALSCAANGHDVRGNTNWGRSHSHPEEGGIKAPGANRILTGSGPDSWRHDGTAHGIADLVGNVWEWVGGLKLVSGKIIMPHDNDFNLPEAEWPEAGACINLIEGKLTISAKITKRGWDGKSFMEVATAPGFNVPLAIHQALLCPSETSQLPGYFFADNNSGFEAMPLRGGSWNSPSSCGLAALSLSGVRSLVGGNIGFRPAFIV